MCTEGETSKGPLEIVGYGVTTEARIALVAQDMHQSMLPLAFSRPPIPEESRGVVYTKRWVVELLLDLADYLPETNLVDAFAVEPAAGEGAFLIAMVRRLVASCERQGRPLTDCLKSLVAYEIDEQSAQAARLSVIDALMASKVDGRTARKLAESWVKTGDYLFDAPMLPRADFAIGNPPYIRLEDMPVETAGFYRSSYPTMRGRADIYVAFFEAALRQLKDGGVCAYICADRWMLNQYGAELRQLITSRFNVQTIVEMHNADAFDADVSAYPAITVIQRGTQGKVVVASAEAPVESLDSQKLAQSLRPDETGQRVKPYPPIISSAVVESWFEGSDPWPCSSPKRLALLRQLEEKFPALEDGEHTRIGIGVATGCDSVFITKDKSLVEPDRLLPLAMAPDTLTGHLKWSGNYLVDPWGPEGLVKLSAFPKLKAYFQTHKEILCRRHTAKKNVGGWYKTIDRVTHPLKERPKLYIPDIKDKFNPVFDKGETYPHHNLYFVVSDIWDLEVLGGILLSSVAQLFVEAYGVRMRGGYLRFQAQYLRRIRVPNPRTIKQKQGRRLAEAFRARDREQATRVALEIYAIEPSELEAVRGY
jgi:adenine-specific DNA-methyltransferase